ncbi:unnamed protein product, partial [Closterium sp. NIES-54]
FQLPPSTWDLVYAPMLLGLLVLLVAVLLSIMIAVLAWKRRNLEEDVKEIQLCTAILERAERSKSEAVASTSHELSTPIIGMMAVGVAIGGVAAGRPGRCKGVCGRDGGAHQPSVGPRQAAGRHAAARDSPVLPATHRSRGDCSC